MAELGYRPDETARALASGRQRAVDVIAVTYGPGIGWLGTHPYFSRVLAGMMSVLEGVNAQLRLHAICPDPCAIDRRAGYLQAVRSLELFEVSADGDFHREGGYRAATQLLERHPDIDAMFIACDLMAAGAVQAITATGRRVPDDVSIIGFDDSIAAVCTNPPLTTMRLPVEDMAASTTRLLLQGNPAAGHRQRFPVDLVTRDSARR